MTLRLRERHPVPAKTRAATLAALREGLRPLQAEKPLSLTEWAMKHFELDEESSHKQGTWEPWPPQVGIMEALSDDRIVEVDVEKAKRTGYALALDTPIPTPSGWTTMGALQPGDKVLDEQGRPCTVRYCSPVFTDHECYRITFCDGTSVVADKGHRWLVESRVSLEYLLGERGRGVVGRPKPGQVATTRGVIDTGQMAQIQAGAWSYNQLRIRNTQPLQLPPADLPIPPYTLGLWLGDGHLVTPRITQHHLDVETADYIRAEGIDVTVRYLDERYPGNATLLLDVPNEGRPKSPWAARFRALGLLKRKHIPQAYLRASFKQRLQLLRGLMDSDGTAGKDGRCEFANTSSELAEGVHELVVSMGFKASISFRSSRHAAHQDQYRVNFKPTPDINPFNLTRKAARMIEATRPTITHCRRVVTVEPVPSVPVRCIEVDSPSHLFLCTRGMVPTHNTKILAAWAAYSMGHRRRKTGIWQPTDDDRDSFEKTEIAPAFERCKPVQRARHVGKDHDTIKFKRFRGAVLHLLGAKAARAFRRITLDNAALDEVDAMDQVVEKTIDPVTGARGRLEGAAFPKLVIGSTLRIKGLSHVRRRTEVADARMRFHVECPHCQVETPILWGGKEVAHGFKWDGMDPKASPATVRHVCPHCHGEFHQTDYLAAWKRGVWVDEIKAAYRLGLDRIWRDGQGNPCDPPPHVAFVGYWAAYSPQRTWSDIVREFIEAHISLAKGEKGPMMGFKNETLADLWEEEFEQTEVDVLLERAKLEPRLPLRTVPARACKVLMTIDVQGDRWEATAWAVGRDEEVWPIDYQVIYGNLADPAEWAAKLDPLLATIYKHQLGKALPVHAAAIDTGGHYTQLAYNFVRKRPHKRLYAIKGEGELNQPIVMKPSRVDVSLKGKTLKKGLVLWRICVDTAKDLLHERLKNVTQPGPACFHLHPDLPVAWYEQLTAEKRIPVRTTRGVEYRWTCPSGHRNEALDMAVYLLFLVRVLKWDTLPATTWQEWEDQLQPGLFDAPELDPVQAAGPAAETVAPEPDENLAPEDSPPPPPPPPPVKIKPRPPAPAYSGGLGSSDWSSRL